MMNLNDAINFLELPVGIVTPDDVKLAYRKAAFKYHPDRNPAGLEMMKLVNLAYEKLKNYNGEVKSGSNFDYGEKINNALNAIINLNLEIEICGSWVWVGGDTRSHIDILKASGFLWSAKKVRWYFRPNHSKSKNRRTSWSMDKIRSKYGSKAVEKEQNTVLLH